MLALRLFLCCTFCSALLSGQQRFDIGKMRYGIYFVPGLPEITNAPYTFRNGKPVYDVSKYEWIDKAFEEYSEAGISMVTFAYVHTPYGHIVVPSDPRIPFDEKWEGIDAVDNFLKAANKYKIDTFLATWIPKRRDQSEADYLDFVNRVMKDIIDKYQDHPRVVGFVPPVEVDWENLNAVASNIKKMNPKLLLMDFPMPPLTPLELGAAIVHGNHPDFDIENVQFRAYPAQLFTGDFSGVRGIEQSLVGAIPGKDVLCHTHYDIMSGPYMVHSEAWEVKQAAILSATPFGTHSFSFLEGFWGEASFRTGEPTLWRAIAWYKGILSVQRMAPYYGRAENTAPVAILVPRYPVVSSTDLVERVWLWLARKHIPTRFFLDDKNLGHPQVVIVPSLQGLSPEQVSLLRQFTAHGGVTVALTGKDQKPADIEKLYGADPDASLEDPRLGELFGFGIAPQRLERKPSQVIWPEPLIFEHEFAKGLGVAITGEPTLYPIFLPDTVLEHLQRSVRVTGLPRSVIVEQYAKSGQGKHELVLFLGTDKNEKASDVRVFLPDGRASERYYWFSDSEVVKLEPVAKEDGVELQPPPIRDFGGLLRIGSSGTFPILLPSELYRECRRGEVVNLSVGLTNTFASTIRGEMRITVPAGWEVVAGQGQHYDLQPDGQQRFQFRVRVPQQVEKRCRFVTFSTLGLEQRTMLVAVDGDPHKVTDHSPYPRTNQDPWVVRY